MLRKIKQKANWLLRKGINAFGFDVVRMENNPMHTFLGLRSLPIKTVIDIGANTGQFAKVILNVFPNIKLICLEPLPDQYSLLKHWADSVNYDQITTYNIAVGDRTGEEEIYYHSEHSPSSSLLPSTELLLNTYPNTITNSKIPIKVDTLDNILDPFSEKLDSDILIKIDVQGYEDRVLRGSEKILKLTKALLLEVNIDSFYQGQASFKELLLRLDKAGFYYAGNLEQIFDKNGFLSYFDALFLKK